MTVICAPTDDPLLAAVDHDLSSVRKILCMIPVSQVGTAALLNVPASLEKVLKEMKAHGYDLGRAGDNLDGEALVAALKVWFLDFPPLRKKTAGGRDGRQEAVGNGFQTRPQMPRQEDLEENLNSRLRRLDRRDGMTNREPPFWAVFHTVRRSIDYPAIKEGTDSSDAFLESSQRRCYEVP